MNPTGRNVAALALHQNKIRIPLTSEIAGIIVFVVLKGGTPPERGRVDARHTFGQSDPRKIPTGSKQPIADARDTFRNRNLRKCITIFKCGIADLRHALGERDRHNAPTILERRFSDGRHSRRDHNLRQVLAVRERLVENLLCIFVNPARGDLCALALYQREIRIRAASEITGVVIFIVFQIFAVGKRIRIQTICLPGWRPLGKNEFRILTAVS